ncbi:hypothetical protein DL96DRAFT_1801520 [Flagelloscypha sp. PMI_526]|nr:hypothetical protein DL96DRAFT_1801520 [Flagelloscypha sp. PMI_526]
MALRLSAVYDQTGRWNDVANIYERAKEFGRPISGWEIETFTNNLATAYKALGRHAEALELELSVLAKLKQTRGEKDSETLASMNNLATTYRALGRHEEALDLFLSVIANQKQTLGDEHSDTLHTMINLASVYHHFGRHAEALDLQLSAVTSWKQTLGEEHPYTLTGMNNLTETYRALGRHAEALDLQVSVHVSRKRILGDEHSDTLTSMINLISTYQYLGRHAEALDLLLSVLAVQKRNLGNDHPDTLTTMSNLAETYRALGRHAEALDLQLSVLANRNRVLGDEHPDTLTSKNNLAATYIHLERHAESVDLLLSVVANQKRILGDEHPDTLASMNNLALSYTNLGMHTKALDLQLSLVANREQILIDEHPDTLTSMNNLAETYRALGRYEEALDLLLSVVASFKRTLGDDHPNTLASMNNLASLYTHLGRHADALDLHLSVLTNWKRTLGDGHVNTLTSMNNLASTYQALGRHAEATDLLIPAVSVALRVLGAEHSTTLILQSRLENGLTHDSGEPADGSFHEELYAINATIEQYEQEERWEEAAEQGEIAVETFSAILGEHHLKTLLCMMNLTKNFLQLGRMEDARLHIERMYRIVKDDNFSSEGFLHQVLIIEELYSRFCLGTTQEAQLSLAQPKVNLAAPEVERDTNENLVPLAEDERLPQARAADAAEARRKALNKQLKVREEVKDDKTASSSKPTQTENFPMASVVPPVTNLVNAPRMSQPASHAPKRSQETIWKGKARDRSHIPSDQNERTAPVITNTRVDGPSVEQQNLELPSSTVDSERQALTNKVHTQTIRTNDPQELDASISSQTAVASTSSALLPAETKGQTRGPEIANSHMSAPHIYSTLSENEAHERYMANMDLKKIKVHAKSEKQERQCRLEMARMIVFALIILGVQWRDTKRSGDE